MWIKFDALILKLDRMIKSKHSIFKFSLLVGFAALVAYHARSAAKQANV